PRPRTRDVESLTERRSAQLRLGRVSHASHQCRIRSSADFQSAVSPICNRLGSEPFVTHIFSAPAEYNSAIQQIENLRYDTTSNFLPSFRLLKHEQVPLRNNLLIRNKFESEM